MPIAGDLVATAMCYGTVISLAILYVRTVTDASGRQAMDHSYDVIESSNNLIVHGQLMPFEHRPGPDLHVWNGMLNPRVVQVRGEHCQFVNLESNVENKWYQQTSTLKALAEWCIHCAPTVVPTVPRDPYPCMPTAPTGDKVATDSGPSSVECQICQRTVPHRVLRTHIGQHILRGHHIEGQAERSCANICGFCGSRDECTIRLPLQTRSTRKRMVRHFRAKTRQGGGGGGSRRKGSGPGGPPVPGTGMAAGARGTAGTRWCGGAFCWVTALSRAGGPAPHHLGGGGGPCKHARVHDYGRALPEHPSGVAVPLGPFLGRAGPGPPLGGGGGGTSSRPLGSGRGAPLPFPRAHTARAAARRARSCPAPCAPRASLPLGRHRLSSPPAPLLRPVSALGGGGGQSGRPGEGRGGGGLVTSRPVAGPRLRRGRPVRRVLHPHPRSLPAPPVARAGRCPHVAGPQRHVQRHRQAAERAQVVAFAASRMLSAAPCAGAAIRPRRRWTAHLGARSDWASRVLVGPPRGLAGQGGEGCAGAFASSPGGARSRPAGGAPPRWSRRLGCSGAVRCT